MTEMLNHLGSIPLLLAVVAIATALAVNYIPGFAEPAFAAGEGIIGQATPEIGQFTVDYENGKIKYSFSLKEKIGTIGLRTTNAEKIRSIEVRMLSYDSKDIPVPLTAATGDTQIGPAINDMDNLRDGKYYPRSGDYPVDKPLLPGQYKFFVKIYTKDGKVIETPAAETWLRFFDEPYLETFDGTIAGCTDCNVPVCKEQLYEAGWFHPTVNRRYNIPVQAMETSDIAWNNCRDLWHEEIGRVAGETSPCVSVRQDGTKLIFVSFDDCSTGPAGIKGRVVDQFSKEAGRIHFLVSACEKIGARQIPGTTEERLTELGRLLSVEDAEAALDSAVSGATICTRTTQEKLEENGFEGFDLHRRDDVRQEIITKVRLVVGGLSLKVDSGEVNTQWFVVGNQHVSGQSLSWEWTQYARQSPYGGQTESGSMQLPAPTDEVVSSALLPVNEPGRYVLDLTVTGEDPRHLRIETGFYTNKYIELYNGELGADGKEATVNIAGITCDGRCSVFEKKRVAFNKPSHEVPSSDYSKVWAETPHSPGCKYELNSKGMYELIDCTPEDVDALYKALLEAKGSADLATQLYQCERESPDADVSGKIRKKEVENVCKAKEELEKNLKEQLHWINIDEAQT